MNAKQKTTQILELLKYRHEPPEWATFRELSTRTGFSPQRIDFFAFNVWPSKKFWRVAYEVKTTRSDYKNEIARPDKRKIAESLANECFFVTPAGLVKVDEIPEGWGLIELSSGKGGLRIKKHAKQRNEGSAVPMGFMAALARRSSDPPPDLPAVTWKFGGKDLTYEELIAAADHAMERREEFIRNEGRDKILDSEDYKRLIDLRGILRNTLGWEYEDPDKLRAYFATQREKIIDRDTRWKVKNARDVLNSLLEHLE